MRVKIKFDDGSWRIFSKKYWFSTWKYEGFELTKEFARKRALQIKNPVEEEV